MVTITRNIHANLRLFSNNNDTFYRSNTYYMLSLVARGFSKV